MKKISYLGPKGTYSEQATHELAKNIKEDMEFVPLVSLETVAKSVDSNNSDFGVVPYYNYLEGLVQECLDLVYENDLRIIGAKRFPIVLSIGSHKDWSDRDVVYSHPKALAQCSDYLLDHHPKSKQVAVTSTAEGAKKVSETKSGLAVASLKALEKYGLNIIAENVGNKRQGRTNFTDFYLVSKKNNVKEEDGKDYLTMVAITPHIDESGLLANILFQIAYHGLNNAKIHSRPALDEVDIRTEPQMFYLEIMCHKDFEDFKRCIDALKYKFTPKGKDIEVVRVLGSYERPWL